MDAERPGLSVDFSELASARAAINAAENPTSSTVNILSMVAAAPSNLTAPSAVVLCAGVLTPKTTGVVLVSLSLTYTISGAGTMTAVIQIVPTVTAIAGGTTPSSQIQWHVENGGTAVSLTGGSPTTLATVAKTATASASTDFSYTIPMSAPTFPIVIGSQFGIQVVVTSAVNLTSMQLAGYILEQS